MKLCREYLAIPERAVCYTRGCPWRQDGDQAETLAAVHTERNHHQVRVTPALHILIFTMERRTTPAEAMR